MADALIMLVDKEIVLFFFYRTVSSETESTTTN